MTAWGLRIGRLVSVMTPLTLGGALLIAAQGAKTPPEKVEIQKLATPARIITLEAADVVPRAVGFGVVTPGRTFRAIARIEGEVIWTADTLEDGRIVSEGEALLRIDRTDLQLELAQIEAQIAALVAQGETLRASLSIEEGDLTLVETELARQRELATRGTAAKASVDQAERQTLAARAKVQSLNNQITLTEAERDVLEVQRQQAERALTFSVVAAPYDMRIGEVTVEVGQFVSRGQEMFTGDGIAVAEIAAQFPIGRLRPLVTGRVGTATGPIGLEAVVRLRAPTRVIEWEATVDRVGQIVDPRTQSGIVVVRVEHSYAQAEAGKRPPLRRNTFLEVELRAVSRTALVVPIEAVREGKLLVLDAQNRLEIREPAIAYRIGSAAVLTSGAAAGERVVVSELAAPVPGMMILPSEDESLKKHVLAEAANRPLGTVNSK